MPYMSPRARVRVQQTTADAPLEFLKFLTEAPMPAESKCGDADVSSSWRAGLGKTTAFTKQCCPNAVGISSWRTQACRPEEGLGSHVNQTPWAYART